MKSETSSFEKIASVENEKIWNENIDFASENEKLEIEKFIRDPKYYLGEGGAAKVFDIGNRCIKLLKNRHKSQNVHLLKLNNPPQKEMFIQDVLKDLEVEGARVPTVVGFYEGLESSAIVMEKLDAVNMQLVINGKESLPVSFEINKFFSALEGFVAAMHERGIIHNDLFARNIMIDQQSGMPRVIDFGLSVVVDENNENKASLIEKDYNLIDKAFQKMEEHIANAKEKKDV